MTAQPEKRGRRRWNAAEKSALVQKWQTSGLSAREFGMREGVSAANLTRWRCAKDALKRSERAAMVFAPVHVTAANLEREARSGRAVLELVLQGDTRVRVLEGADSKVIGELIAALVRGA